MLEASQALSLYNYLQETSFSPNPQLTTAYKQSIRHLCKWDTDAHSYMEERGPASLQWLESVTAPPAADGLPWRTTTLQTQ